MEAGFGFVQSGPDVFHVFPAMLAAEAGDLETAAALFALALPSWMNWTGAISRSRPMSRSPSSPGRWIAPMRARAIYFGSRAFRRRARPCLLRGRPRRWGSVSRYLGQMAALMGDWDRVETDFARAMRRNLETGARAEVAETRFDWATALLRRGLARDRERGGRDARGGGARRRRARDGAAQAACLGRPGRARKLDEVR